MQQKDRKRLELAKITEAIGYFLAGLFAMSTTLIHVSGENITIEVPNSTAIITVSNWLTLIIGAILVIAGLFLLLTLVIGFVEKAWDKVEKYILPVLFTITITEVISRAIELYKILVLFVPTVIFIIVILVVIVKKATSVFWWDVDRLLTMSITTIGMGIVLLFQQVDGFRWDLLFIFIIIFLLLARASKVYLEKIKSKDREKTS